MARKDTTVEPLVSIIIPVLNGDRFLAEAIDSALAQDYEAIEVIVVDDGSDDHSASIAASYEGVRCISLSHVGVAAARNAGGRTARGTLLGFLDHDDRITRTKVTRQVRYLRSHPEVGCVLGRMRTLVEPGFEPPPWVRPLLAPAEVAWTAIASALVRRETFEASGGFDESLSDHSDHEWLFRLREAGVGIAALPEVVYVRRIHEANMTHGIDPGPEWMLEAMKQSLDRRREWAEGTGP
jgi:glycosyltransferase involved in cell wall biosynthesis